MERQSSVTTQSISRSLSEQANLCNRDAVRLCQQKRYEEAVALFSQVIQLDPTNYDAWYGRGDALANLKRYQDALNNFNQATRLSPYNHEAWTFRGVVLLHLERFQEALESCDRALSLKSTDREAWAFRGAALQRLDRYQEAYRSYDRATGRQRSSWLAALISLFKKLLEGLSHLRLTKTVKKLN